MYSVSTSTSGFIRNLQKVSIVLPKLECKQQTVAARAVITAAAATDGSLHIHECMLRRSAAPPTARTARPDAARSQIILSRLVRTYSSLFTLSEKKTNCYPLSTTPIKCHHTVHTILYNAQIFHLTEGMLQSAAFLQTFVVLNKSRLWVGSVDSEKNRL